MIGQGEPRQLWCERAVVGDPSRAQVVDSVTLSVSGGTIADVVVGEPPPDAAERLGGITVPGFANAHSHAFHRALRGRTHHGSGDFWTWREQMYAVAGRLTPENYHRLARATFAEMVMAGYTVVGEFHYVHHQPGGRPYDDPNAMADVLLRAAREAGIRITLLDACYLRGGAGVELVDEQRRFSDGSAAAWAERVAALVDRETPVARAGAAIHSARALDAPAIATVARFASERSMPLHAHVSEQVAENEQVRREYGCSPIEILAQQGALSSRFTAVHATHLTPTDIGLCSMAGCAVCLCPTTERDLADGIGPSIELRDAGVALAIGSDQHAVIDPFEEMRAIEHDERLRSMRRGNHGASALFAAGTAAGYRSLGWDGGGRIEVGAPADLVAISTGSVRLAGMPHSSPVDAIVFAAGAGDVDTVIVHGTTVVRGGRHLGVDVAGELRTAIASVYGEPS